VVAPLSHGAGVHAVAQVARAVTSVLPGSERFDATTSEASVSGLVPGIRSQRWLVMTKAIWPWVSTGALRRRGGLGLGRAPPRHQHVHRADDPEDDGRAGQHRDVAGDLAEAEILHDHLAEAAQRPLLVLAVPVKIGTCGFERTGMQVQIQDGEGREVAPGETGEIPGRPRPRAGRGAAP
jgi:fatty-acyl-CoA synthase